MANRFDFLFLYTILYFNNLTMISTNMKNNTIKSNQNYFVLKIDGLLNIYPALNMEKTNFHEQTI